MAPVYKLLNRIQYNLVIYLKYTSIVGSIVLIVLVVLPVVFKSIKVLLITVHDVHSCLGVFEIIDPDFALLGLDSEEIGTAKARIGAEDNDRVVPDEYRNRKGSGRRELNKITAATTYGGGSMLHCALSPSRGSSTTRSRSRMVCKGLVFVMCISA